MCVNQGFYKVILVFDKEDPISLIKIRKTVHLVTVSQETAL